MVKFRKLNCWMLLTKTRIAKMNKITKIFLAFIVLVGLFSFIPTTSTYAAEDLSIYLFWGNGCPHCAKEKEYLAEVLPDFPNVTLKTYQIYGDQANINLMQAASTKLNANASGVPFLIIGDQDFIGYAEGTTDVAIKERLEYCTNNSCPDSIATIVSSGEAVVEPESATEIIEDEKIIDSSDITETESNNETIKSEEIIDLPFLGKINALDFSLPLLAIIIGVLDGFNPCAMWTLMFLISLLLGMKSRRRMWALGVTFIVASASVYFLFMAAWLQLILFLGFVVWIRTIIGLLAVIGGGYNLFDYFRNRNKETGCKVTGSEKRQLVFAKMKKIAHQNSLWLALGGIVLLAFAVNLVELVCSAGFPAIFTQVLSLSNLSTIQYYSYILLYILFFMIDDIIIFAIAMFTLKATGISTKYGKLSKVIGGALMIIIGLLLVFKPELLMFG